MGQVISDDITKPMGRDCGFGGSTPKELFVETKASQSHTTADATPHPAYTAYRKDHPDVAVGPSVHLALQYALTRLNEEMAQAALLRAGKLSGGVGGIAHIALDALSGVTYSAEPATPTWFVNQKLLKCRLYTFHGTFRVTPPAPAPPGGAPSSSSAANASLSDSRVELVCSVWIANDQFDKFMVEIA